MASKRLGRLMTMAVLAGAAAACESSTGPAGLTTFDADAALSDYDKVDAILTSNSWKNFKVFGGMASQQLGPVPTLALEAAFELREIDNAATAREFAGAMTHLVGNMDPVAANAPIVSAERRGKTFVFDTLTDEYALSERTGAPANGVRFIVYETDILGTPNVENETGYFDLLDEGDNSAEDIALRLVAVDGSLTVLEYATTLDANGPSGTITVDGFLTDGTDRLDFDIDVSGTDVEGDQKLDVTFEMRVDALDFVIEGSVMGTDNASGEVGTVDLTVRHGSDSFRVDVSGTETTIAGTFYLNDEVFATMSGDPENPTFVGAGGEGLTQKEALVLHRIVDSIEDVFDFFEDLMDPLDELIILAVIL